MPVVGTSGHVDHGKTALIAALTGTDTDRLPEEKLRGMTTDLGFAHFLDAADRAVGVIDVPGHERYMRNMTAGAAGIDGAILVVAADDGWMEQTGRHLQVLDALGVPILAVALTKMDLVPEERLAEVEKDILVRLGSRSTGDNASGSQAEHPALPSVCRVNALSGEGVDSLRSRLLAGIRAGMAHSARFEPEIPHLFVDRIFPLRGTGLVVAGSLRGGSIAAGDELSLYPAEERLRVRGIQAYGVEVSRAGPGSRVALAIARPKAELTRGACIAPPGDTFAGRRSVYLRLDGRRQEEKPGGLRPGMEVELAAGTTTRVAQLFPARVPGFIRLSWEEPLALFVGQRILALRHGGADILAAGSVVAFGGEKAAGRRAIEAGFLAGGETAGREGKMLSIRSEGKGPQGAPKVLQEVPSEAKTVEVGPAPLSAAAQGLLSALQASTEPGCECSTQAQSPGNPPRTGQALAGTKKVIGELCEAGILVSLDGTLFMESNRYREYARAVVRTAKTGAAIGISEAKDATRLSRKWIIPLLNRMERDGFLKREGEVRRVLRSPPREGSLSASGLSESPKRPQNEAW